MKIKSLFAVALAATTLLSCSKDNEGNTPVPGAGETASLNISVTTQTKATGTPPNTDTTVSGFSVFVTNSSNEIEWKTYTTGASLNGMSVTTDATDVYIVANSGDLTSAITTLADLNAYTADMSGSQNQFTSRWATGKTATPLAFSANALGDQEANATVNLTFIAARITVTIVDNMTPAYDATAPNLVLTDVAVLNAGQHSKLFGTSLAVTPAYYLAGFDGLAAGLGVWPTNFSVSPNYTDGIAAMDFNTKYYYYVFENDAVAAIDFPTIVTLVAEFNGDERYFPVHLAPYEDWVVTSDPYTSKSIERGKSYDITITLSVDPTQDSGVVDPTIPDTSADVNISVVVNDWDPVVLEKEFN